MQTLVAPHLKLLDLRLGLRALVKRGQNKANGDCRCGRHGEQSSKRHDGSLNQSNASPWSSLRTLNLAEPKVLNRL